MHCKPLVPPPPCGVCLTTVRAPVCRLMLATTWSFWMCLQ